jgi:hypothetical protein
VPLTLETPELGEFLSLHAATLAAIAHTTSHRRIASSLRAVGEVAVRERWLARWKRCTSDAREERHREQRAGV